MDFLSGVRDYPRQYPRQSHKLEIHAYVSMQVFKYVLVCENKWNVELVVNLHILHI